MIHDIVSDTSVTDVEREWIAKIETIRTGLLASTQEIEIQDYGAVSPDLNLTPEQMYSGRIVKRTIGAMSHNAFAPRDALALMKIVRQYKPALCLELGTSIGMSASYVAAALRMNGFGKIITLEGAPTVAEIARQTFDALDLDNVEGIVGRFQDTLDDVLLANDPFGYVLIDGHHSGPATVGYFETIVPFTAPGAVVVFDDITWSDGMKAAWDKVQCDQRVREVATVNGIGILQL